MHQILIVVQVLVAIGLIGIVLIQQGRGADAGAAFGSGGSGTIFGARGPASALTRITAALAVAFFVNSIALAYVSRAESDAMRSVVETVAPGDTPLSDSLPPPPPDSASSEAAPQDVAVPPAPGASVTPPANDAVAVPAPPGSEEPSSSEGPAPASSNN